MIIMNIPTNWAESKPVALCVIASAVLVAVYSLHAQFYLQRRISRLGARAQIVLPHKLPYGLRKDTSLPSVT